LYTQYTTILLLLTVTANLSGCASYYHYKSTSTMDATIVFESSKNRYAQSSYSIKLDPEHDQNCDGYKTVGILQIGATPFIRDSRSAQIPVGSPIAFNGKVRIVEGHTFYNCTFGDYSFTPVAQGKYTVNTDLIYNDGKGTHGGINCKMDIEQIMADGRHVEINNQLDVISSCASSK